MAVYTTEPGYVDFLEFSGSQFLRANAYFLASGAISADSTTIVAQSDWYPGPPQAPGLPTIVVGGDFQYGNLGTVTGTVTSYSVRFDGADLINVTGLQADAGEFWLSLLSESVYDHIDAAFYGDDEFLGSSATDALYAGNGADLIKGFGGEDWLYGEEGADVILGGLGGDHISGGLGNDKIRGGKGKDYLNGDEQADKLRGQGGDDQLNGGAGNDRLYGGAGNDVLNGGSGRDNLSGGAGVDRFEFRISSDVNAGVDRILDWEAGEGIDIYGVGDAALVDFVQSGTDTVINYLTNSITVLDATVSEVEDWVSVL